MMAMCSKLPLIITTGTASDQTAGSFLYSSNTYILFPGFAKLFYILVGDCELCAVEYVSSCCYILFFIVLEGCQRVRRDFVGMQDLGLYICPNARRTKILMESKSHEFPRLHFPWKKTKVRRSRHLFPLLESLVQR